MYKPILPKKLLKIEVLFKKDYKTTNIGTYKVDFIGSNLNININGDFIFISFEDSKTEITTKIFHLNEISAYKKYYKE